MIKSNLTTSVVEAYVGNYSKGRSGRKVCKITPHHVAGVCSGTQCARLFQNPARQASANYCIGNSGDIVCSVGEENRAWTSSSWDNDTQAITIEVSNCEVGGQWRISDAAWNSLVNLCVDICKRYGFKLVYDGTPNGSLTRHNMFASTACPGPYLQGRFQELANAVNARLEKQKPAPTETKYKVGDEVTINGVYVSSTSVEKLKPAITTGKITRIVAGANNPYLVHHGDVGIGWVNDNCITAKASNAVYKKVSNCYWLNLRTSPEYSNNVYKVVKAGTKVEYLSTAGGWCKIKYDGKTLYCGSDFLS